MTEEKRSPDYPEIHELSEQAQSLIFTLSNSALENIQFTQIFVQGIIETHDLLEEKNVILHHLKELKVLPTD